MPDVTLPEIVSSCLHVWGHPFMFLLSRYIAYKSLLSGRQSFYEGIVAEMDVRRSEAGPSPLLDLSKDELLCILNLLSQTEKCRIVPLVCKAFARTLKSTGNVLMHLCQTMPRMPCNNTNMDAGDGMHICDA